MAERSALRGPWIGKTLAGAVAVNHAVFAYGYRRPALAGRTAADVRDVMVLGQSGIVATAPPANPARYEPSRRRVTWANGAEALLYSSEEPSQARGPEHDVEWKDEQAAWRPARGEHLADTLADAIRIAPGPRSIITTTPRPQRRLRDLQRRGGTDWRVLPTLENAANLPPEYIEGLRERYEGTREWDQEVLGLLIEPAGALWSWDIIEAAEQRDAFPPEAAERIIIAVDPAYTAKASSAQTAIAVAGVRGEQAVVYEVEGLRASTAAWAARVVDLAAAYGVDTIYVETNGPRDLLVDSLRPLTQGLRVRELLATKSKTERAQPVSLLYKQGRVAHWRTPDPHRPDVLRIAPGLHALADQMVDFPDGEDRDMVDAVVYALTELLVKQRAQFEPFFA